MYCHHGGDNQIWNVDTEGLISSQLEPRMFLTESSGSLALSSNKEEAVRWKIEKETGMIRMKNDPGMVITEKCGKLLMAPGRDESPQQIWDIIDADKEIESAAKPATSCHLKYPIPDSVDLDTATDWELRCSVKVTQSCPSTYFCVVGWSPAGYSGIQEIGKDRRVAIFSMWNTDLGDHRVELLRAGEGTVVDNFGGEGTGLKTMKDLDWQLGEKITFVVSGVKEDDAWICSCFFLHRGQTHFMASYRRTGPRPLSASGFYSFVEDWDRCSGAEGHLVCRMAEFTEQQISVKGRDTRLSDAVFTKVEHGRDKFACSKARGGVMQRGSAAFFLATGGSAEGGVTPHNTRLCCSEYHQ